MSSSSGDELFQMQKIWVGVGLAITLLAFVGNALIIFVLTKPIFAKNSISIYCPALAIFDSIVLLRALPDIGIFFNAGLTFAAQSMLLCKLDVYLVSQTSVTAWIMVCINININII